MNDTGNDTANDLLDAPEFAALAAARTVPPPSAAVLAASLAAVRAAAAAEDVSAAAAPAPAPRSRHHRRRWIAAAACVAAIAAGVSVLPTVGRGGQSPASANAASAFLNEVAAHTTGPDAAKARKLEVRFAERVLDFPDVRGSLLADRSGGTFKLTHTPDPGGSYPVAPFLSPRLTWDDAIRLPSGTAALRARLKQVAPRDQDTFTAIGGLLTMSPLTPQVRAALYRVLATVPGVVLLGPGVDTQGRAGRWVARDSGSVRWKLLIEPSTGRLLEQEEVTLRPASGGLCRIVSGRRVCPPKLSPGDTLAWMTILSSRLS